MRAKLRALSSPTTEDTFAGQSDAMLKKLRIKFVGLIMGVAAVLLTAAFTAICYLDWQQSVTDTDLALDAAIQQASGTLPMNASGAVPPGQEGAFDPAALDPAEVTLDRTVVDDQGGSAGEGHWGESGGMRSIYPATKSGRFATRPVPDMFTAVYEQEGDQFVFLQESSSAMWVPEVVGDYADELRAHPDGTGMLGNTIYYLKKTLPEGCYVAMVYAGPLETWKGLAVNLVWVGAAVLLVLLAVSVAFSRWALRPVKAAWAQQQQFVADASHDLKTPLTVILANTAILLDEPDQPADDQRRWLESTRDEALGMQVLVEDMLLSARADTTTSAASPADLSRLVAREALQFESVAFDRQIDLRTDIAPEICVQMPEPDARRLVQILLDNACKYADDAGTVRVVLTVDAAAGQARFTVSNTGPSIAEADVPHLFDRFYRADAARTSHEGHGLGLAIARSIVERAGGTIAAANESSITTLTVILPLG
ncbi:sensor histidine kinase [Adlercreutzia murintestinalis]|uniref:sensor histidine kinase n=1 Tax=Adlercreutzia murintestinalis TaxID=2941325 RepID=UPI00203EA725|nr:HAMP domain-containing sensor histidine kinase [Adlercreutzia murintestinalis]